MEKPKCKLTGEDSNTLNLVAIASKCLKRVGMAEQAKEMRGKVFASGSHDEALQVIMGYVEVE